MQHLYLYLLFLLQARSPNAPPTAPPTASAQDDVNLRLLSQQFVDRFTVLLDLWTSQAQLLEEKMKVYIYLCFYMSVLLSTFIFSLSLSPLSPSFLSLSFSLSLSLSPLPFLCPSYLSLQLVTLYLEAYYSCYDKTEREKLTQVRITYCVYVCVYAVLCTEYIE